MEDRVGSSPPKELFHRDRINHSPSKLPSFKFTANKIRDRIRTSFTTESNLIAALALDNNKGTRNNNDDQTQSCDSEINTTTSFVPAGVSMPSRENFKESEATSASRQRLSQSASRISPGTETNPEPPTALITRRSYTRKETTAANSNPTAAWLDTQHQHSNSLPIDAGAHSTQATRDSNSTDERKAVIPPIRSFRSSTAKLSAEMNGRIPSYRYDGGGREDDDTEDDRDRTLRALEGSENRSRNYYNYQTNNNINGKSGQGDQRQAVDSDDLFLNLARDGFTSGSTNITSRPEKRRVGHFIYLYTWIIWALIMHARSARNARSYATRL